MPTATSGPFAATPADAPRWLLFVHQIPNRASNARVRTWRRLQQMGAVAVKQAVYVLPNTAEARERFEWLQAELRDSRGDATLFAADVVDTWSDDALVEEFRKARRTDYETLAREIAPVARQLERRRQSARRGPGIGATLERWIRRLAELERIDYFGGCGRDEVVTLLARIEPHVTGARPPLGDASREPRAGYQKRVWVTRPRPGVDRMASAWLIRAFIDPEASFGFAADRDAVPDTAVAFDMFGVRFTHHDGGCTFETLCRAFDIHDAAVAQLALLVHALDLEDTPALADGPTVQAIIEGLQLAHPDDRTLLEHGMTLFDALHRTYQQRHRSSEPPRTAGRKGASRPRRGSRTRSGG
jgi:hypothetical protein